MLLNFTFENHRSFAEEQELSLIASNLKEQDSFVISTSGSPDILPVALVYGANASGKSNIVDAFQDFKRLIRHSHSRGNPSGGVPRDPFRLASDYQKRPSKYQLDFILDDTPYQYGYTIDSEEIIEEWLYAFPNNGRQTWYFRNKSEYKFGRKYLKGSLESAKSITRENSLFLSAASQNNVKQLVNIFNFIININSINSNDYGGKLDIDENFLPEINEYLKTADFGIVSSETKIIPVSELQKTFMKTFVQTLEEKSPNVENIFEKRMEEGIKIINFGHRDENGNPVFLGNEAESSGTLKFASLLGTVLSTLKTGGVIFIDELDQHLHTHLSNQIISLFKSEETNKSGAQLIATVHDTNLLASDTLRRDEIWFVEKDRDGKSVLYPLSDFTVRNTENLEKGYLDGRFGAVPYLGSVRKLIEKIDS